MGRKVRLDDKEVENEGFRRWRIGGANKSKGGRLVVQQQFGC